MAIFSKHDISGHETLEYDLKTDAGVAAAMEKFKALVEGEKFTAATKKAGARECVKTTCFDPNAEETVFLRPMQGG